MKRFLPDCLLYPYIRIYLCDMTKDDALYIKIETPLKNHVNQYVKEKNVKGGLSEMVRQMLIKKTAYKTPKV